MTTVEAALLKVGQAVVTPFFRHWLGARRSARERSLPLSDLLRQRAKDEFSRRRGQREIDAVVDEVGERLQPLIRTRFAELPENEVIAALEAVADTFGRADLSDDALFGADLQPARLLPHLRSAEPPAGLSELGSRLYDVMLEDCARCFTQFVVQTAPFTNRAQVAILSRLSEVTELMTEAVHKLALAVPDSTTDFLSRYRDFLAKKLNTLELVGLDTQYRPRTTLSVAYISLAVIGDGSTSRSQRVFWDPGLLRHARLDGADSERVEQALSRRTRTLIRGEAGAGKSTLLRWLAVTASRGGFTGALSDWNGRVPFLIKLRSWPDALPAPEQFLTGVADPVAGAKPGHWVTEQFRDGRALLLVDGVDELPVERRAPVRGWLRDLLTAYPDILVVVTSRPPAAPVRWLEAEGFEPLTLDRLSPADVRALIDQWHQAARTSPSLPCPPSELPRYEQALLTQLAANRHLSRLAGNPLMAAMLCALNLDRQTNLPPDRMGIYQAAVDMLLHKRDQDRGVTTALPDMTVPESLQLLQDLAWRISLNNRSELSRAEAEAYVSRRLAGMHRITASAGTVLEYLVERSGVLREPAAERIDFVHRTVQEYLAAREAAEQAMAGLLVGQAHLDGWREIIIMATGLANRPMRTEIIDGLLHRAAAESRHRRALILLATSCLEALPALPPELLAEVERRLAGLLPPRSLPESRSLQPVGEPLLRRLEGNPARLSEAQAAATIATAALINGPRAIEILGRFTHDARRRVQLELIKSWKYFEPYEYAERVLADAPLDDGEAGVTEPSLLAATHHLRHLTGLQAVFDTRCDLDACPPLPHLKWLHLRLGWDGRLNALDRHPALENLLITSDARRPTAAEIRSLVRLPRLRVLTLYAPGSVDAEALTTIAEMSWLQYLNLSLREVRDLSTLAALTDLRGIYFEGGRVDSLAGLRNCPITTLGFGAMDRRPTVPDGDWGAAFPHLEHVNFWNGDPPDLGFAATVPTMQSLRVTNADSPTVRSLRSPRSLTQLMVEFDEHSPDLGPLLRHRQMSSLALHSPGSLDLSPLVDWEGGPLRVIVRRGQQISGRDLLPATIRVSRRAELAW
ncbi:NACHT domain-containing protein [Actinoplanes oblitus]|uniref:NACHT domain-containing protein n=1 Tax=Actinoplanes oblitus TaxID=3040509 RepID=A0ABY8WA28_9ACTN|nr:NACHT domain-containing protein [Actinoplanes oblitus]WIM94704.1 NACHT domain-containing protein [Actinoplanes oblitus]